MFKYEVLRDGNFVIYLIGGIITILGDQLLIMGLALYTLKATGSAGLYSSVLVISTIPAIILGPISGSIVDRFNKKRLLIIIDLIRGGVLLIVFLLNINSFPGITEIYLVALIFGICDSLYGNIAATLVPIILDKEHLIQGNMIGASVFQVSRIIGPILGAALYAMFSYGTFILIDSITFFITASLVVFIKLKPLCVDLTRKKITLQILEGFRLLKDKEILNITLGSMCTQLFVVPIFLVGIPFMVKNVFSGTDMNLGAVKSVFSIGIALAFFTVPIINKYYKEELRASNIGMFGMLGSILILFLLLFEQFYYLILNNNAIMTFYFSVVSFIFALSVSSYSVFYSSFTQKKVDAELLGRYFAISTMFAGVGKVAGNKGFGFLFDYNKLYLVILIGCIGVVVKLLLNRSIIIKSK